MNTINEDQLESLRAMQSPLMAKDATLRDWFAGMALSRLIHDWCEGDPKHADTCADTAYKFADAMLAARKEAR